MKYPNSKPQIIAHSGASSVAPKNTIISGKIAADLGADGWEIDIQYTKDHKFVLRHGPKLLDSTNIDKIFPERQNEPVWSFTLEELKKLDAGSWFSKKYSSTPISSLEDALKFARTTKMFVVLDIKEPMDSEGNRIINDEKYFKNLFGVLKSANMDERLWLYSRNRKLLDFFRNSAPNMKTVWWLSKAPPSIEEFKKIGYSMISTNHRAYRRQLNQYLKANIPVELFTVNHERKFKKLWRLGYKLIETDRVEIMTELLKK